jgi:hypothetical protein
VLCVLKLVVLLGLMVDLLVSWLVANLLLVLQQLVGPSCYTVAMVMALVVLAIVAAFTLLLAALYQWVLLVGLYLCMPVILMLLPPLQAAMLTCTLVMVLQQLALSGLQLVMWQVLVTAVACCWLRVLQTTMPLGILAA